MAFEFINTNPGRRMILHIKYNSAIIDVKIITEDLLFWINNAKLTYGLEILEYYKLENKTSEIRNPNKSVDSSFIVIVGKSPFDIQRIKEFANNCPRLNEYSGLVEMYELYPKDLKT